MASTASGLIAEAKSLADLQNSKNVTYQDQVNFINEAYRDVYSKYTESGGDYFVTDYVFDLLPAWVDPNVPSGTNFFVPLPADFYKVRFVDYYTGGQWQTVDVFASSQRDFTFPVPRYRLKNNTLWLIVSPGTATRFRLSYYTPPAVVTVPEEMRLFGQSLAAYNKPLATWPTAIVKGKSMAYVYNGTVITVQSLDNNTIIVLLSAAGAVTWLAYNKGYLYWIQAGNILRAPTDLVSTPIVPATIVATGLVQNLRIWDDQLYYYNGTNTLTAALDGSGVTTFQTGFSKDVCKVLGLTAYINVSGRLVINGNVDGLYSSVVSDGTYLYARDALGALYRLTVDAVGRVTATALLQTDVGVLYSIAGGFLGCLSMTDSNLEEISVVPDTVFTFPANEVNEILAYQAGLAFCRKNMDEKRVAKLEARLYDPNEGLWARFFAVNKRDENQFQRVNDGYSNSGVTGYQW